MSIKFPDRLPNETDKQWNAFMQYLLLGGDRTIEKAYRKAYPDPSKPVSSVWKEWCFRNKWVDRAREFDNQLSVLAGYLLAQKYGDDVQRYYESYSKSHQVANQIGIQLLTKLAEVTKLSIDKMPEKKAQIESVKLTATAFNSITQGLKNTHDSWQSVLGIERLAEKVKDIEVGQ